MTRPENWKHPDQFSKPRDNSPATNPISAITAARCNDPQNSLNLTFSTTSKYHSTQLLRGRKLSDETTVSRSYIHSTHVQLVPTLWHIQQSNDSISTTTIPTTKPTNHLRDTYWYGTPRSQCSTTDSHGTPVGTP